ncbi:hypothetical protein ACFL6I_08415 [candidate division KSB1 bacterium]
MRTTSEFEKDGVIWGKVLGGKEIKIDDIPVPGSNTQKRRYMDRLRHHGYIITYKSRWGIRVYVMKSKRNRVQNVSPNNNDRSESESAHICSPDRTDLNASPNINGRSVINIDGRENNINYDKRARDKVSLKASDYEQPDLRKVFQSKFRILFNAVVEEKQLEKLFNVSKSVRDQWEGYYNQTWEHILIHISLSRMRELKEELKKKGDVIKDPIGFFMKGIFNKGDEKYLLMFDECGKFKK